MVQSDQHRPFFCFLPSQVRQVNACTSLKILFPVSPLCPSKSSPCKCNTTFSPLSSPFPSTYHSCLFLYVGVTKHRGQMVSTPIPFFGGCVFRCHIRYSAYPDNFLVVFLTLSVQILVEYCLKLGFNCLLLHPFLFIFRCCIT
jgi:hypothetical protein